jgi:hypothetical protein
MAGDLLSQYDNSLAAAHGISIDDRAQQQALEAATQVLPVPANL